MISIPYTSKEKDRVKKLIELNILDTPAEKDFDDIVQLASQICETPISLISLVDDSRQWFKSKVGVEATETPREWAFCAHAVNNNDLLIVEDATKDERFFDNPLVTDNPDIRFYAGYPLRTSDNFALGTLCVIDRKPNSLNEMQIFALETLANQVVKNIEARVTNKVLAEYLNTISEKNAELEKANDIKKKLISIISHDLRTPLSNLVNLIYLFENRIISQEETFSIINDLKLGVNVSINLMDNLLTWSFAQSNNESIFIDEFLPSYIVDEQFNLLRPNANFKNINLQNSITKETTIYADYKMLEFVVRNLVANAIKFSENSNIDVYYESESIIENNQIFKYDVICIKDYGVGMPDKVKENLFDWNNKVTTIGTNKEKGTGLGLLISKEFVEKMNGKLEFESELGKGTTFKIKLPQKEK